MAKHASRKKADIKTDVLIVGGGLAGLTLAGVLGEAGIDTVILDHAPPVTQLAKNFDSRATALSFAASRVLPAAGVWDKIAAHAAPVLDIRVTDGEAPVFLHFSSDADGKGEAFGFNVENLLLRKVLFDNVKRLHKTVRHLAPVKIAKFIEEKAFSGVVLEDGRRIVAPLMVGADGRGSAVRKWLGIETETSDYKQTAIVCTIAHELDHEGVATEHFLPAGPFALLPLPSGHDGAYRSSVIWTVETADAQKYLSLSTAAFDAQLQKLCGPHLGKVRCVQKPAGYPLSLMHAASYAGPRTALMAEAAHVIHPIAGQGLNVSMRDIAVLAELAADSLKLGLDHGTPMLLQNYEQLRRIDAHIMAGFTDVLNRLFSNNFKSVALARDLGLGMVEKIAPLKGFFASQAMGLGGRTPRIVKTGRL